MKKYTEKEVNEFLEESNAIEGVYDDESLVHAREAWDYLCGVDELTVHDVLKTHEILMKNQPLQVDEKGFFRRQQVRVGGRECIRWEKIGLEMAEWLEDVRVSILQPGVDGNHIKLDHITYEKIHPFIDGNGRTGRMFMNWQRMKAGLPILIIHEGHEQRAYYEWFK